MDKHLVQNMLRQNWYLILLCLFFLGMGLYKFHSGGANENPTGGKPLKIKHYVQAGENFKAETRQRLSKEEKTRAVIAEHEAKIAAGELSPDDAAAYMNAIGNLHMQRLSEYKEAAEQFELLLSKYPDWNRAGSVYTKLALCYERMEDEAQAQQVYMRIRSIFPPDSPEYQMATEELGLKD